eukprot:1489978-Amphidinium_carterae.1
MTNLAFPGDAAEHVHDVLTKTTLLMAQRYNPSTSQRKCQKNTATSISSSPQTKPTSSSITSS